MDDPIYLDYNATTPVAPEVVEAMIPALRDAWGNPSSAHVYGQRAREVMDKARSQVARLLGCEPDEIVFTGGGTESDNAAIVGVAEALADRGKHVATSAVEHPAVDKACSYLETRGWEVTRVPVDHHGQVSAGDVEAALRADTVLVSVMHANNETGVIQPVAAIGSIVRRRGIVFHTDAAQSVGKIPVRVDDLDVDLLTVAGHKFYAPKGVGALYIRQGTPVARFIHGAGHEAGRRSGTENTPQIAGLGVACTLADRELGARQQHLKMLRDRLEARLRERIPDLVVHGASVERLPNTLCAAFPGADAGELLSHLDGVAAAAGAACDSGKTEPSRVLKAMNVPDELGRCTLRLTVGRPTAIEQVDRAAERIAAAVKAAREAARVG